MINYTKCDKKNGFPMRRDLSLLIQLEDFNARNRLGLGAHESRGQAFLTFFTTTTNASRWLSGEGRRSQVCTAQMHTALTQNVQDQPGALHFTRLKCTRLKHRTCKTSRGHFASLVVSKKVRATWCDFIFFSQKKCLLRGGIFIFCKISPIQKIKV